MKKGQPARPTTPGIQKNLCMAIANDRYADVLEALCDRKFTPATVAQIAGRTRRPELQVVQSLVQLKKWELVESSPTVTLRVGPPEHEYSIPEEYRPRIARILNEVRVLVSMTRTVEMPREEAVEAK